MLVGPVTASSLVVRFVPVMYRLCMALTVCVSRNALFHVTGGPVLLPAFYMSLFQFFNGYYHPQAHSVRATSFGLWPNPRVAVTAAEATGIGFRRLSSVDKPVVVCVCMGPAPFPL